MLHALCHAPLRASARCLSIRRCYGAAILCVVLLLGCERQEQIRHYTVPKPETIAAQVESSLKVEAVDRMLAAIVPDGEVAWFFKLAGPIADMDAQADAFRQFLASVKLPKGNDPGPTWKLPDGWRQHPASGMRYATIDVPSKGDKPLDLSVSMLPRNEDTDETKFNLDNINRWRGQMGLRPLTAAKLATETEVLEIDGAKAVLVDLRGKLELTGMGGRFAGGGPFSGAGPMAPSAPARPTTPPPSSSKPLTYEVPEGWRELPATGMRRAAFSIGAGSKQAEVTIIAAQGSLVDNVNRWRGQINLEPEDAAKIEAAAQTIDVDGSTGTLVELMGPESADPRQAILGAIVDHGGQTWFIKFMGDADLATAEKERFAAFVRSLKFNDKESDSDGQ